MTSETPFLEQQIFNEIALLIQQSHEFLERATALIDQLSECEQKMRRAEISMEASFQQKAAPCFRKRSRSRR